MKSSLNGNNHKRSIILLAVGARADVMEELVQAGKLPEISRWLVESGSFHKGTTVFPSTTGPAYLPFLTGVSPGTCNVPGIRWMNKAEFAKGKWLAGHRSYVGIESFMIGRDIAKPIQTIFELVPDSYSIFNTIARGAGNRNLTRISRLWYVYYAHLTDRWSFIDEASLQNIFQAIDAKARFMFAVFPGIDEYSHLAHPHHESTYERYAWLDRAVGKIVKKLKERGEWETTQLWVVADHGLTKTDTHFCPNEFLAKRDLPAFFYPMIHDRRGKKSATMVSGNGMAHLYFRNRDGWSRPTSRHELAEMAPKLVKDFVAEDAIDLVLCRDDKHGVDILSRRGQGKVVLNHGHVEYQVFKGDPLGFGDIPKKLSIDDSLALSHHTDYPDALYQIANLFRSNRTGDVVLSATPGYDLRLKYEHPEHRGSHGSLHRLHMHVPILCNTKLDQGPMRTVDVFPTVLEFLNHPIPGFVEGKSRLM
ncbi:MAG: alkaline phosphatase family protein [Deltaproteobacteria bacterium]|nr:alkaline phosphatase family protein [Deltaproteobacteria bacterium]